MLQIMAIGAAIAAKFNTRASDCRVGTTQQMLNIVTNPSEFTQIETLQRVFYDVLMHFLWEMAVLKGIANQKKNSFYYSPERKTF